jgi:hypothetical protein
MGNQVSAKSLGESLSRLVPRKLLRKRATIFGIKTKMGGACVADDE